MFSKSLLITSFTIALLLVVVSKMVFDFAFKFIEDKVIAFNEFKVACSVEKYRLCAFHTLSIVLITLSTFELPTISVFFNDCDMS